MKKLSILFLAVATLLLSGCYAARIVTVSPSHHVGYSTTISYPTSNVATNIYASDYDLCLHLDLQAVGAAFAQASTVREFEILLNNSSYMISNLDLNRDGYLDYLRVVETLDRYTHIFVIQAVLGRNIYQDVATIIVENPSYASTYVEIIGEPFLYGQKYIVRPIYKTRPYIFNHLCSRNYQVWRSPWYWDFYPAQFKRPRPQYLSHYQAYVSTFMHNHHYCDRVLYPADYHYRNYQTIIVEVHRDDYAKQHPEQHFQVRTVQSATNTGSGSAVRRPVNASDIRAAQEADTKVTTSNSSTAVRRTSTSSSTSSSSSSSASTSANRTTATTGTANHTTATSGTTNRTTATSGTSSANRTTATTGSTNRTTATSSSSSANRTTSTAGTGSATRSTATSGSSTSRSTTSASGSTGTATRRTTTGTGSSSSAARSEGTTTVNSRVSNSGASRTTTTRSSSSSTSSSTTRSSSATRSTSSSSATRSAGSTSATRSSSTSGSTGTAVRRTN